MIAYPAVLFPPDAHGTVGCAIPDLLVNASGRDADDALRDAAGIMAELLSDMARKGEPFPDPTPSQDVDLMGGTLVLVTAQPPSQAA